MVTAVTNKILPQMEEWQQRLYQLYPIVFIDAIHFSVRDEHTSEKKIAAYIILGVNDEVRGSFKHNHWQNEVRNIGWEF